MKVRNSIVIIFVFVFSFFSCEKDKEQKNSDSTIYFTGISKKDFEGNSLSEPDETDWRFDDEWTTKEEDLFTETYSCSNQECLTNIVVYPNPFQNRFILNLSDLPNSSRLAIRLVNKNFDVLFEHDSIEGIVSIMPPNISGYDTLRLYYKLIDSENYEFKGHGDILVQE